MLIPILRLSGYATLSASDFVRSSIEDLVMVFQIQSVCTCLQNIVLKAPTSNSICPRTWLAGPRPVMIPQTATCFPSKAAADSLPHWNSIQYTTRGVQVRKRRQQPLFSLCPSNPIPVIAQQSQSLNVSLWTTPNASATLKEQLGPHEWLNWSSLGVYLNFADNKSSDEVKWIWGRPLRPPWAPKWIYYRNFLANFSRFK